MGLKQFVFLITILYCNFFSVFKCKNNLVEKFSWKTIDFQYVNEEARRTSLRSQEFIPLNNIPFGIEVWREKIFVTIPRRNPGIPSTLNYIPSKCNWSSPLLQPYPDWKSNNLSSKFLISTYRVNVDSCNRLWTVDTGSVIDFEGKGERIITPRIRVFDLLTDKLIVEYILKQEDLVCDSSFTSIIADIGSNCDEAHAYAADPGSSALLVYSLSQNQTWRIKHPYFLPDPMNTNYKIGNIEFQWDDGLFGLALGEKLNNKFRNLYVHPMSSLNEFIISTEILRNETAIRQNLRNLVRIIGTRKETFQAAASTYDERNSVYFYSLVAKNAIGCWNSKKFNNKFDWSYTDIVAENNTTMIYFSDLKVDKENQLWAISNRLPLVLYNNLNTNDINFRIFSAPIRQVIKETNCEHARLFWSKRV